MNNSGHVDAHCPRQLMFAALVIPVGLAAGLRSSSYTRRGEIKAQGQRKYSCRGKLATDPATSDWLW
jgi:hypothetical protein